MTQPRSVGLVGLDYSGSTILTAMLDTLHGVFGAGETHWIVDRQLGCRECGSEVCPVFTVSVLGGLRSDPTGWWSRLADAGRARVVVSSDKRPVHYRTLGVPDALIYLYKDPIAHVASRLRRTSPASGSVEDAVEWYVSHSLNRLNWVGNVDRPVIGLAFETVVAETAAVLRRLSSFIEVDYAPAAARFWEHPHHYIGGNFSVKAAAALGRFDNGLRTGDAWHDVISPAVAERLLEDAGIQRVVDRTHELPNLD